MVLEGGCGCFAYGCVEHYDKYVIISVMKPEFGRYRGDRTIPKEVVTARIPANLRAEVELIATMEGDTLSGLLVEGLTRVVEDRRSDPNYMADLEQGVHAQMQATRQATVERVANVRAALENLTGESGRA